MYSKSYLIASNEMPDASEGPSTGIESKTCVLVVTIWQKTQNAYVSASIFLLFINTDGL